MKKLKNELSVDKATMRVIGTSKSNYLPRIEYHIREANLRKLSEKEKASKAKQARI